MPRRPTEGEAEPAAQNLCGLCGRIVPENEPQPPRCRNHVDPRGDAS